MYFTNVGCDAPGISIGKALISLHVVTQPFLGVCHGISDEALVFSRNTHEPLQVSESRQMTNDKLLTNLKCSSRYREH